MIMLSWLHSCDFLFEKMIYVSFGILVKEIRSRGPDSQNKKYHCNERIPVTGREVGNEL
jgi:hypothetical protein